MNSGPLSDVMCNGAPCLVNTWVRNNLVRLADVTESWVGMNNVYFVSWSTMTNMDVCPSYDGSCSMKSMDKDSQGFTGIGSCLSRL